MIRYTSLYVWCHKMTENDRGEAEGCAGWTMGKNLSSILSHHTIVVVVHDVALRQLCSRARNNHYLGMSQHTHAALRKHKIFSSLPFYEAAVTISLHIPCVLLCTMQWARHIACTAQHRAQPPIHSFGMQYLWPINMGRIVLIVGNKMRARIWSHFCIEITFFPFLTLPSLSRLSISVSFFNFHFFAIFMATKIPHGCVCDGCWCACSNIQNHSHSNLISRPLKYE